VGDDANPPPQEAGAKDASSSDAPLGNDAATCTFSYRPSNIDLSQVDPCSATGDLNLPGPCTLDTDALTITCINAINGYTAKSIAQRASGGGDIAVFVAHSLTIPSNGLLTTSGSKVAAFLLSGNARIDGTIVAKAGAMQPASSNTGPGGSFCVRGGYYNSTSPDTTFGAQTLIPLVGGETAPNGGSSSGAGGGGFQISANGAIDITQAGVINAGGAGGTNTGGGAGGAILLEAPSVTVEGVVAANGGAGGPNGQPGQASTAQATTGAACDPRPCVGTGAGGAGNTPIGGSGYFSNGFNAYGGGGVGYLHFNTATALAGTGTLSPLSTVAACTTQGPLLH
jgi:hypothetical protein